MGTTASYQQKNFSQKNTLEYLLKVFLLFLCVFYEHLVHKLSTLTYTLLYLAKKKILNGMDLFLFFLRNTFCIFTEFVS